MNLSGCFSILFLYNKSQFVQINGRKSEHGYRLHMRVIHACTCWGLRLCLPPFVLWRNWCRLYSATSLKYHTECTPNDTRPGIILTMGRPVGVYTLIAWSVTQEQQLPMWQNLGMSRPGYDHVVHTNTTGQSNIGRLLWYTCMYTFSGSIVPDLPQPVRGRGGCRMTRVGTVCCGQL